MGLRQIGRVSTTLLYVHWSDNGIESASEVEVDFLYVNWSASGIASEYVRDNFFCIVS